MFKMKKLYLSVNVRTNARMFSIDGSETLIPRSTRVICRYSNDRLLLHFILMSTRMAEEVEIDIEQCERETNDGERKRILKRLLQML